MRREIVIVLEAQSSLGRSAGEAYTFPQRRKVSLSETPEMHWGWACFSLEFPKLYASKETGMPSRRRGTPADGTRHTAGGLASPTSAPAPVSGAAAGRSSVLSLAGAQPRGGQPFSVGTASGWSSPAQAGRPARPREKPHRGCADSPPSPGGAPAGAGARGGRTAAEPRQADCIGAGRVSSSPRFKETKDNNEAFCFFFRNF